MSVEIDEPQIEEAAGVFTLTSRERAEVAALAGLMTTTPPGLVDDPRWIIVARQMSCRLPERLRQALRDLRHDAGDDGMLLIRGLPVDAALPTTPSVAGSVQRGAAPSASVLALVAQQIGEMVAFREEKSGALVQDVVPVPGMEDFQGNAGSVRLTMHVENAFHRDRPDLVGLFCLRSDHDQVAGLEVASSRPALRLLSNDVREVLHQPRYLTEPPGSFGLDGAALSAEPHAILNGNVEDPDIRIDFTSTRPLDDEAAEAMARLGDALTRVRRTLVLRPGDLALVDNRLALHGRTAFRPRYDGNDRWLQRVFINLDFRRSRRARSANGYVICGKTFM